MKMGTEKFRSGDERRQPTGREASHDADRHTVWVLFYYRLKWPERSHCLNPFKYLKHAEDTAVFFSLSAHFKHTPQSRSAANHKQKKTPLLKKKKGFSASLSASLCSFS